MKTYLNESGAAQPLPALHCISLHPFLRLFFVLFALVFCLWSRGVTLRIWSTVFLREALWMEPFVKTLHRLRNDWCLKRENKVSSGAFRKRHFLDVLREELTVSSVGMLRPPSGAARRRASWGARLRCEADREWLFLHAILLLCVFFFFSSCAAALGAAASQRQNTLTIMVNLWWCFPPLFPFFPLSPPVLQPHSLSQLTPPLHRGSSGPDRRSRQKEGTIYK